MIGGSATAALLDACQKLSEARTSITPSGGWKQLCPLEDASVPVTVCRELEEEAGTSSGSRAQVRAQSASLFGGFSREFKKGTPDNTFLQTLAVVDGAEAVAFTGGRPAVLEWCPTCTNEHDDNDDNKNEAEGSKNPAKRAKTGAGWRQWRYLAVGVQSKVQRSRGGAEAPLRGCGMIQLWRLPHSRGADPEESIPRFVMGLLHEGALTRAMSWCPASERCAPWCSDGNPRRSGSSTALVGLLAAAHGDGTVAIYAIPQRPFAKEHERRGGDGDAKVGRMDPIMKLDLWKEAGCLPSCLEWLPSEPHDLLLAGTWDGNVVLIKVCSTSSRLVLLKKINVLRQGVRAVRFPPPGRTTLSEDKPERNVIAVGGQDGSIRLWDLRDPFEPFEEMRRLRQQTVTDLRWLDALTLAITHDDGSLRSIEPKPDKEGLQKEKYMLVEQLQMDAPLLSCDITPGRLGFEYTVCAGEGGAVAIQKTGSRHRRREPGAALFATKKVEGGLKFEAPVVFRDTKPPAEPHGCKETVAAAVPDEELSVLSARWATTGEGDNVFRVASAHASGLLRVQTFRLPHPPAAQA